MRRTVIGWIVFDANNQPAREKAGGVVVFKDFEAAISATVDGGDVRPAVQVRDDRPAPRGRRPKQQQEE